MNRISGLIVLLLGILILCEMRRLSIGNLNAPGPGFFPAILGVLLIILSFPLIIPKGKRESEEHPFLDSSISLRRLLRVFAALLGYSLLIEYLGFLVVGFLLMTFLFAVSASQKWFVALLAALASVGGIYILFGMLLKTYLPSGVLGF